MDKGMSGFIDHRALSFRVARWRIPRCRRVLMHPSKGHALFGFTSDWMQYANSPFFIYLFIGPLRFVCLFIALNVSPKCVSSERHGNLAPFQPGEKTQAD